VQPAPSSPTLKFGPYLLDMRAGELRKNGSRIRLQEKPLRVLAALAEQQGQVVTREELRKRLWPDDTFVDFETGLNTAVSKLRDALSDTAEKPRFIETLPRRGYRFVSPVEIVAANGNGRGEAAAPVVSISHTAAAFPANADVPVASAVPQEEVGPKILPRTGVAAGIAALALAFWWLTPLPDPRILSIYPVTNTARQDFLVRPATDGVRIFYVERNGDHYDLMQVSVEGGESQKMAAPFPNTLIWDVSSDGSQYLMTSFVHRGDPAPLWSWPATGGPPIKIGDVVSGNATWSPDGKMIAGHAGHELFVTNADGSGRRVLATFREEPDSPVWSPDGNRIRFNLNDPDKDTGSIWEIRPDGRDFHPVFPNWKKPTRLFGGTWTPDGRYFIFVDASSARSRLWALREQGSWWQRSPRGPFLLAAEPSGSWSPFVGRDGKHVYFYSGSQLQETERMDLKSHRFADFLTQIRPAMMLSFSRDGLWVSYVHAETGLLWCSRADGNGRQQLTESGLQVGFPRWSTDGQGLAFSGSRAGQPINVYTIPAKGGNPEQLVPGTDGLSDPDWSPDGSSIVVTRDIAASANAPADSMLAIVDLKSRQVKDVDGSRHRAFARWSPDGRYLAALNDVTHSIDIYELRSATWRTLSPGRSIGQPAWSGDGTYLYYQDLLQPGEPLFRAHVKSGRVDKVADFQDVLNGGVHRCVFLGLAPNGDPLVSFLRTDSDIYGAAVSFP